MDTQKIIAIIFIMAGALGLAYGGFTYTKKTNEADIGSLHLSIDEKQYVNIPIWLGVGGILVGGLMLVSRKN